MVSSALDSKSGISDNLAWLHKIMSSDNNKQSQLLIDYSRVISVNFALKYKWQYVND